MKKESADLVVFNATIITLDPRFPRAEALAVKSERIMALGDSRKILSLTGSATQIIDGRGLTVIPGFNDNHIHAAGMGSFYQHPNLFGKTAPQIISTLKEHYRGIKPGKLIKGFSWDYSFCPDPAKEILDQEFPANPVILDQYSGHAVWMSSLALQKVLRLEKRHPAAVGEIIRDGKGEPTGIVRGTIVRPSRLRDMSRRIININIPNHIKLIKSALARLAEVGVTSVQDNTWQPLTVWALAGLKRRGELSARFSCWPFGHRPLISLSMEFCPYDRFWIRRGPEKYIVDGAFSPHTAWMIEPYQNEPENCGEAVLKPQALKKIVIRAAKRERQLAFHAIGDRAVREVANAVEEAAAIFPVVKNIRIRLEHAQIIDRADIPRLAGLGILVAAQPTALAQADRDRALVGASRFAALYPYRSLLAANVPLSFGSDIPGENEYNPFQVIYRAVSRKGLPGNRDTYELNEALSVEEALVALTRGSAYAEFMEQRKGTLAPGMLADFVMLSDDLLKTAIERIPRIQVLLTVVGGRIVYSKDM